MDDDFYEPPPMLYKDVDARYNEREKGKNNLIFFSRSNKLKRLEFQKTVLNSKQQNYEYDTSRKQFQ